MSENPVNCWNTLKPDVTIPLRENVATRKTTQDEVFTEMGNQQPSHLGNQVEGSETMGEPKAFVGGRKGDNSLIVRDNVTERSKLLSHVDDIVRAFGETQGNQSEMNWSVQNGLVTNLPNITAYVVGKSSFFLADVKLREKARKLRSQLDTKAGIKTPVSGNAYGMNPVKQYRNISPHETAAAS